MGAVSIPDPSHRQVLVSLGNRYAVFGLDSNSGQPLQFDPESDTEDLPRVADEELVAEERIVQSLRVSGMTRSTKEEGDPEADLELIDNEGKHVFIEVKVRERDPRQRDLEHSLELMSDAAGQGRELQIWYFNIERLKLFVMEIDNSQLRTNKFIPLDVWERSAEGIFNRARVVKRVDDWTCQIVTLYRTVCEWLTELPSLHDEQSRTVTISEELMQKFAVSDREVAVLDILESDEVVASFVPRGIWLIGTSARIDLITRDRTHILIIGDSAEDPEWRLVSNQNRWQTEPFDKDSFLALVNIS